ncbi:MAG: hypothetical protein VCF24_14710 [Candidatus Latescibacterota bacterium]
MNGFDRATQGARLLLFMSLAPMTLGSEARAQATGIISTIVEVEEKEQPSTAVLPAVMIGMEAY